MTKLLMALGLVVSIPAFAEDQVQISDKIMLGANNTPATGSLSVSLPAMTEPDGTQVAASTQTVQVASDGSFSLTAFPTITATSSTGQPGPLYATVRYYTASSGSMTQKWYIPESGSPGVTFPLTIQEVLKPSPLNLPTLAALPSTCTAGATGFYSGTQYICTATNVWTAVPLDYQHLAGTPNALTQSQLGQPNGVAGLDGSAKLPPNEIPAIPYGDLTGAPNLALYALQSSLGTASTHAATDFLTAASAGLSNGIATLDANGKVPQAQIPPINVSGITGLGTAATHPATDFLFANVLGQPSGAAQLDNTGKLITGELPALTTSQISDFPASLPPSGNAAGDLAGAYPAPTVKGINGTLLSSLGAGLLKQNGSGVPAIATNSDIANALGYMAADVAKNGSDFTNAATFRNNIGLGSAATHAATDFLPDPGTNGIVTRTAAGTDGVAGQSDVTGALGFTPANAALLGAHSGIATLDNNGQVPIGQIPNIPFTQVTGVPSYVPSASVGVANGVASLDGTGKVPSAQIPAQPFATTSLPGEIIVGNTLQISTGGNGNPAAGTLDVKTGQYDPAGAATTAQNNSLQKSANLSDVADAATARGNLGVLSAALHQASDFIAASTEGVANGVATLDNTIKVPIAQIPNIPLGDIPGLGTIATHAEGDYVASSARGAANGVASLDANTQVPVAQIPNIPATQITGLGTASTHPASDFVATTAVNAANGVAGLDSTTKVPVAEIPALPYAIISNPPTISAVGQSGAYADLTGAPTALPPNGPASGDLGGSFPNPTVTGLNGTKLSGLGTGLLSLNTGGIPAIAGASAVSSSLGYTPMNPANNLGDVASIPTARSVLGLGSAATHAATDFLGDSGTNGLVMRTGAGTTATATSADIITGIGFTPLGPSSIGAANGVAGLDAGGKVPIAQIPNIPFTQVTGVPSYILSSLIGASNGVAPLDSTGKVPSADLPAQPTATGTVPGVVTIGSGFIAQDAASGKLSVDGTLYDPAGAAAAVATASIPTSAKGAANGVATLDNSTKIPIAQIPTIPYTSLSGAPTSFPPSGVAGGDLGSSYPTPTVVGINGQNMAALGAGVLAQSSSGIPRLATSSDVTALLGFTPVNAANIGVANGIAGLDATAKVPLTQIPVIPYTQLSGTPVIPPQYILPAATDAALGGVIVGQGFSVNSGGTISANFGTAQGTIMQGNDGRVTGAVQSSTLGQPGGVATLNSSGLVPNSELGPAQSVTNAAVLAALGFTPLSSTSVGANGGIASLDNTGKVPIGQIPVIPYADLFGTPTLGTIASHNTTDFVANNAGAVESALGFTPISSATVGQASGIAGLDANGLLLANELPAIPYADLTGAPTGLPPIGAASGDLGGTYPAPKVVALNGTNLAGLGAGILQQNSAGVPSIANSAGLIASLGFTPVNANTLGAANGVATLDSGGKVPLVQVPSLPYSIISNPPTIPPQYVLPVGTASVLGGFMYGTGLSATGSGVLSVNYGTTSGTAAQGNDARITGALQTSQLGAAGGVAELDGSQHVPLAEIPASAIVTQANVLTALGYTPVNPNVIGAANGIASLDGNTKIPIAQIPQIPSTDITGLPVFGDIVTHNASEFVAANQTAIISALGFTPVNNASVGVANGIATLNANAIIPISEIPTSGIVTNTNVISAIGYTPVDPRTFGQANGPAQLDASGLLPLAELPTHIPVTSVDQGEVAAPAFSYISGLRSDAQLQIDGVTKALGLVSAGSSNNASLRSWNSAVGRTGASHLHAAVIGDSIAGLYGLSDPMNNGWPQRVQSDLQNKYGIGGSGVLPLIQGVLGDNVNGSVFWNITGSIAYPPNGYGGPYNNGAAPGGGRFGSLVNFQPGSSATTKMTYQTTMVKIFYSTGPETVPFDVIIDSTVIGQCGGSSSGYQFAVCTFGAQSQPWQNFEPGAHSLTLRTQSSMTSGHAVYIYGAEFINGASGVEVDNISHTGAEASAYTSDMGEQLATLDYINANEGGVGLVIVELGANEMLDSTPTSTLTSNLDAIISHVSSYSTNPSIVIFDFNEFSGFGQQDAYHQAIQNYAVNHGYALVSMSQYWGPNTAQQNGLLYSDNAHPNDAGNAVEASVVESLLDSGTGGAGAGTVTPGTNVITAAGLNLRENSTYANVDYSGSNHEWQVGAAPHFDGSITSLSDMFYVFDKTNNRAVMTFDPNDAVGIMTGNVVGPSARLEVSDSVIGANDIIPQFKINTDYSTSFATADFTAPGANEMQLVLGGSGSGLGSTFNIYDNTAKVDRVKIAANGNVGIGLAAGTASWTAMPSALLSVGTNSAFTVDSSGNVNAASYKFSLGGGPPGCSGANVGQVWNQGISGSNDKLQICQSNGNGGYNWAQIWDGQISASVIGNGSVNDTTFGYLAGVTSPIQSQLDGTLKMAGGSGAGVPYYPGSGTTFSSVSGTTQQLSGAMALTSYLWNSGSFDTTNALQFQAQGGPPSCGSGNQGEIWNQGISGSQDRFQICASNGSGSYSWQQLWDGYGIPANAIGNGDVNNATLSYLSGATSNIQAQLNGTLKMAGGSQAGIPYYDGSTNQFASVAGTQAQMSAALTLANYLTPQSGSGGYVQANSVLFIPNGSPPSCSSGNRGQVWNQTGSGADVMVVCQNDGSGNYTWQTFKKGVANATALSGFSAALSNSANEPVNIVVIGDSLSSCTQLDCHQGPSNEADIWPAKFGVDLAATYGSHGTGIITLNVGSGTMHRHWDTLNANVNFNYGGNNNTGPSQSDPGGGEGLTEVSTTADGGGVILHGQVGTQPHVYYSGGSGACGTMNAYISNGDTGGTFGQSYTVDTAISGSYGMKRWDGPVLSSDTYSIGLNGPSGCNLYIYGVDWTSGSTGGIEIHNLARGYANSQWFGDVNKMNSVLQLIPGGVQFVIISMGANDWGGNFDPVTWYKANLQTMIDAARGLSPQPSVAIFDEPNYYTDNPNSNGLYQYNFRQQEVALAKADSTAYASVADHWGTVAGATSAGLLNPAPDYHETDNGGLSMAQIAEQAFFPSNVVVAPGGGSSTDSISHATNGGTYQATNTDDTLLTYGTATVILPTSPASGQLITVANTDTVNNTTVQPPSGVQLNGVVNQTSTVAHTTDGATPTSNMYQWDGSSWWTIDRSTTN